MVPSFKIGCSRGEILGTLAGAAGASSCYELNLVCPVHSCQDFHTHCALTLRLLRKPAVDLIGGLPSCAHMFTRPARCVSAIPLLQPWEAALVLPNNASGCTLTSSCVWCLYGLVVLGFVCESLLLPLWVHDICCYCHHHPLNIFLNNESILLLCLKTPCYFNGGVSSSLISFNSFFFHFENRWGESDELEILISHQVHEGCPFQPNNKNNSTIPSKRALYVPFLIHHWNGKWLVQNKQPQNLSIVPHHSIEKVLTHYESL